MNFPFHATIVHGTSKLVSLSWCQTRYEIEQKQRFASLRATETTVVGATCSSVGAATAINLEWDNANTFSIVTAALARQVITRVATFHATT